ncbi:hypothetical protein DCC39_18245 [Pueribacillus theae]|uniref:Uncharacterized protein n=1 Tax=Pueribacillus theae TaxID=2171751 RepID=A0A2U1JK76_9BACI|nr:hypothetical protein [Pueribacillus theae]PWA05273.1 hypothetical protein DCC39_18245 [Pueribacillus theae]
MKKVFEAYSESENVEKLENFLRKERNSLTYEQFYTLTCILKDIDDEMLGHELDGCSCRQLNVLEEIDEILKEAIESLDNGEKVNGLEYARQLIKESMN